MSNVKSAQTWTGLVVTRDGSGALSAATTGPAGALYVNGTSDAASVTITGSNPYKWSVTLPSLTAGDTVSMYITATIAGVATASVVAEAIGDTARTSDVKSDTAAVPTAAANADALLDRAAGVETGLTPRQALRLATAALAGKISGAGTATVTIRNTADTKDRITATVDANGNRSAITVDLT
jgi:predicted RNA-binding protein with TRAM domain